LTQRIFMVCLIILITSSTFRTKLCNLFHKVTFFVDFTTLMALETLTLFYYGDNLFTTEIIESLLILNNKICVVSHLTEIFWKVKFPVWIYSFAIIDLPYWILFL
jgi:hypothetical protein